MLKLILSMLVASLLCLTAGFGSAEEIILYDGETGFNTPPLDYGLGASGVRRLAYGEVPIPLTGELGGEGVGTPTLSTDLGEGNRGYAGYAGYTLTPVISWPPSFRFERVNPDFPTLDRTSGFLVAFNLEIIFETSNPNRAGFSVIVISSDGKGIELGFKQEPSGRIFAQSEDFIEAEDTEFDILSQTDYILGIRGENYTLSAGGAVILTGPLRDYNFDPAASDPALPFNPYKSPDFVFFGDDTDQGNATFTLGVVSVDTGERPAGIDLTLLPELAESPACADTVTYPVRMDLSYEHILDSVNALADFTGSGLFLTQEPEYGYLQLELGNGAIAVQPFDLSHTTQASGVELLSRQSVRLVTGSGIAILTHPAVQAPCGLQAAFADLGLSGFSISADGNVRVPAVEGAWFNMRPDLTSTEALSDSEIGISLTGPTISTGLSTVKLMFEAPMGGLREQLFFPAPAAADALFLSAEHVSLETSGVLSFVIDEQTIKGVLDYLIEKGAGAPPERLSVSVVPDRNGDGTDDYLMHYPTGDQQLLFALP